MTHDAKYIFFGSTKFAAIILGKLVAAGFIPIAVVSNPDRPFGRKKVITPSPVKSFIHDAGLNLKILQPEKLGDEFEQEVRRLEPDFGIVAYYAKIIPQKIVDIFSKGVIGVHPSLLPRYRGPSPIQSAILGGEKETGSTLFLLDEKADHGPVLTVLKCGIAESETNEELSKKLAELGGDLLAAILPKFMSGEMKPQPQNENEATYTKKFGGNDGFIEPGELEKAVSGNSEIAELVYRKVRAFNPEPSTWTIQNGKRVKLLETALENGKLKLKRIQIEGERPKII